MENNNDQNQHGNVSPVTAGLTGFVIGVMGATAVALTDKTTRTRVTNKAVEMKEVLEKWSKDTLHDLKETGDDLKKRRAAEKVTDVKTQSANPADEAKQRLEEALSDDQRKAL